MAKTTSISHALLSFTLLFVGMLGASGQSATFADLQLPHVPTTITDIPQRADYVMTHFWDNLDLQGQPERVNDKNWLEQWTANFLSLLPIATPDGRDKGFSAAIAAFSPDHKALLDFNRLIALYLDEPESPTFSETFYIQFLQSLLQSQALDSYERVKPEYQLAALCKNRQGTVATDINLVDRSQHATSLHAIKAEKLLMILYDPECDHCASIMKEIYNDDILSQAIADNRLTVVAIFADGDLQSWPMVETQLPPLWLGGVDTSGVQENELYTIRDFPALYLLDTDKTVLLKDTTAAGIKDFLSK